MNVGEHGHQFFSLENRGKFFDQKKLERKSENETTKI